MRKDDEWLRRTKVEEEDVADDEVGGIGIASELRLCAGIRGGLALSKSDQN